LDILPLLDEIQTIARNGLAFSTNPYDRERYERLMELASHWYGQALDLPPQEVRARLSSELGYITPKVGADAAILDDSGRILLSLRADDRRWSLPGGWLEPNESPADAAVRETREETGLEARVLGLVDVFSPRAGALGVVHSLVAVVYACEVVGGEMQPSHEVLDLAYWRIEDVPAWHTAHRTYAEAAYSWWSRRGSA
jgi:ADP-ribose pyrophosphatase YjhB (NUDIX family)